MLQNVETFIVVAVVVVVVVAVVVAVVVVVVVVVATVDEMSADAKIVVCPQNLVILTRCRNSKMR